MQWLIQLLKSLWAPPATPSPRHPAVDFSEAFILSDADRDAQRQRQQSQLRIRRDDDGDDVKAVTPTGMGRAQCPGGGCPNRGAN